MNPPPFNKAFLFVDSYGGNLTDIIIYCDKRGCPVNMSAFMRDAIRAGWSSRKLRAVLQEAINQTRNLRIRYYREEPQA